MSSIQVADDTFVAASPHSAAPVIADRVRWRDWWPDLSIRLVEDRGPKGIRWAVDGPLSGTMEIWLEEVLDGFVLHYFLHAEPTTPLPDASRRRADRLAQLTHRRRVAGRAVATEVKRLLESRRSIGDPAVGVAQAP